MPKNPTRKGFFFFLWKGGSHYPIARVNFVEGGKAVQPCRWHSPFWA